MRFVPECDDGYPTEDWLFELKPTEENRFGVSLKDADRLLLETLPAACEQISCCSCEIEDAADEFTGKPIKRIHFSTGGWSGAEDLIAALLQHFWVQYRHVQWRRGGHFIFEVPCA